MIPSEKQTRIESVDALRGFAVMAIVIIHNMEHFIFPVYPDASTQPEWLNILDKGSFTILFSLFAGKAYALFALLFGFTFCIQYDNQLKKKKDFGYRYLWRLLLLTGFSTLNALFFPAGDVLLLFAFTGIILFVVRKWSNKAILILAILLLLQPVEWFYYIASLINPEFQIPDLHVGEMYGKVAEYTKAGKIGPFLLGNITLGQKASLFWAIGAGRFIQTAGLFLIGLLLGRKRRFIIDENNYRFWIFVLIVAAICYTPLYQLKTELMDKQSVALIRSSVGTIMDMWSKLAFTFVLMASFMLLYYTNKFRILTSGLQYYGKMSLTNYISQSYIGAFIYFPFALSLAPYCGFFISFLIGVLTFALQLQFCKWWLKRHKQGPLEYIWHKLTWIGKNNK